MAYSIKASGFNPASLAAAAHRAPMRRIINGVPARANSVSRQITLAYSLLSENDCMTNDNLSEATPEQVSLLCLAAIGIVVESIDSTSPVETFGKTDKTPQNKADEKNEMQRKNYGDNMFPEEDDPFYQMDDSVPDYIKESRSSATGHSTDLRFLTHFTAAVGNLNMTTLSRSVRMKQFVENK